MGIRIWINSKYNQYQEEEIIKIDQNIYWNIISKYDNDKLPLKFYEEYLSLSVDDSQYIRDKIKWVIDNWKDDLVQCVC